LTAWPVFLTDSGNAKKIYYIQAYEPSYYPILKDPIKHLLARGSYLLDLYQIANGSTYNGWGLNPQAIIPPGIDLSIFSPKKSELEPESKSTVTLGTIGRTEPYKGTETALEAYRLLRQSNSKLQMKVGFGNVETADDIEVVPIRGDKELAAFYRSVDILVVSCRGQHGAPHYPLIEAMASGTPVVHTGYYPGDKKNSWQARDSTVEAVADAIQQLIDTPEREKSARVESARETVAQNLSWDAVARRFEAFFHG
jgi:glycosyltransferase involved in cell wall biosynthesis